MSAADDPLLIFVALGVFLAVLIVGVAVCAWIHQRSEARALNRALDAWHVPNEWLKRS